MDLVLFILNHMFSFVATSVPLIVVYILVKGFKIPPIKVMGVLLLMLLQSIFYWMKLENIWDITYQCIPYFLCFLVLLVKTLGQRSH